MEPTEALALVAGKVDQELLLRNEYLGVENEILRSKIPGRVPLTDAERIRLAELGSKLGKKALAEVTTIAKPDTILTWYRNLIAKKYTAAETGKVGRPRIAPELEELIVALARANRSWGYDRIAGALKNLDYEVSDKTIGNVLRRHGIAPAGGRKPKVSWADFIESHLNAYSERWVLSVKSECLSHLVFFSEASVRTEP